MCMPIIGAILSIGVAAAQASAEQKAKTADYNAKVLAWQQNIINSQAAARDEQRQIITKQMQTQAQTSQKVHVSYIDQAQKQATAEVQAGAAGVSGLSLDNILDDIAQKSELNRTYAMTNYQYAVTQTQEDLHASDTKLTSRINQVPVPIQPIDTSGITVLGSVAGAVGKLGGSAGGGSSGFDLGMGG